MEFRARQPLRVRFRKVPALRALLLARRRFWRKNVQRRPVRLAGLRMNGNMTRCSLLSLIVKKLFALCCFLVVTLALPATEGSGWTTDYKAALEQAKADDRRVFLFFTGSDWCGWCKRLNREILSTPEFNKFADDKLVLVELDFPRSKAQTAAVKAQNAELAQRFKIRGYPTIIVLDRSGKKVGQLGYQRGGPAPFVEAIGEM